MKILISSLFFTLAVFIKFGELDATGNRGPPDAEFSFMSHNICLWVDNTRTRVTHVNFEGNYIPEGNYNDDHNYLIRLVNLRGLRFIAYIKQNGSLLGVEPMYPEKFPVNAPEPNEAETYIAYEKRYLRLVLDPVRGSAKRIHLFVRNSPHTGLTPEPVQVAGIRFFVFKNASGRIVAASLTPQ